MTAMNEAQIETVVVGVIRDMTQDWELELDEELGKDTKLIEDLEFESIDIVQFAVSIEKAVDRQGLPFEQLFMKDGDYVDDILVGQVVTFLHGQLAA